jgi:hypothetical protein
MLFRRSLSVAALSAAILLLESTLTRLLAVAQFYHFAFLVISLALLGFGASGTVLSLSTRLRTVLITRLLAWAGIATSASTALAYGVVNLLPFDSYSIAWDRRQVLYFGIYYLALTLPFGCGGLGIGAALAASRGHSHLVYAANLLGSAAGVLLAPFALRLAGVPGAILAGLLVALLPAWSLRPRWPMILVSAGCVMGLAGLSVYNLQERGLLGMTLSPYKGLAQARQIPGARTIFGAWDAVARADVVAGAHTRALPGLSYTFTGDIPEQLGLSLDADSLAPITLAAPGDFAAADFLPEAIAFRLAPSARVLVLEPGGGLGVLQALAGGADAVTAVPGNTLARHAVASAAGAADVYAHTRVQTVDDPARVHLGSDRARYDVVYLPLTDPYRPVTSGAYSLGESYMLTVEAFRAALAHLDAGGMWVTTRWLQKPPSESLRLITTVVEALDASDTDGQAGKTATPPVPAAQALVALRGIQTITVLVKPSGWTAGELAHIRAFAEARRYDLVWAPDVRPDEVNRHNRLAVAEDYEAVRALFTAQDRSAFYASTRFAVAPTTDDRPFFFHFFRWRQTDEVFASLGRTWQPFGGSGYFVLFALLALVLLLSTALILVPLIVRRRTVFQGGRAERSGPVGACLAYFALLGIAFLFVEIPLIQRWILALGHPTYAFTAVVLTVLLFSSLGSALARARWLPRKAALFGLAAFALLTALLGSHAVEAVLGWPAWARVTALVGSLAPVALLMGLPFPLGLAWLESFREQGRGWVPWAWAVNGCASVIASVLAAILALSWGFSAVLALGAGAYAAAAVILRTSSKTSVNGLSR